MFWITALIILNFISLFWGIKNKLSTLIITDCFIKATSRSPTENELKESTNRVINHIVKDVKNFFGNKN